MDADRIINNCEIVARQANLFGCVVALNKADEYIQEGIYTNELVEFLTDNPYGSTNKYQWETRRVDELVNVTIWKVK